MSVKLTIGFATFDDPRMIETIKALALTQSLKGCEILVVDNNPRSKFGESLRDFEKKINGRKPIMRYIGMPDHTGTTQPRERIFKEAAGQYVLVMDSHVVLDPGAIEKLIAYYDAGLDDGNILHGPLVHDDDVTLSTQFNDEWGDDGMWGKWGMDPRAEPISQWRAGKLYGPWVEPPEVEPFEIFAQGLGLFSCRKSAWLGFNPHFLGFGGEECYIHEKFRQAGKKAVLIPWLCWWHDFSRPWGVQYPISNWNKCRNYVLGHLELGRSLDVLHDHFVKKPGRISQADWDHLIADPVKNIVPPAAQKSESCGGCGANKNVKANASLDDLYEHIRGIKRDLDQHLPKLRELAENCDHVTEFTNRRESTYGLAAGRPKTLISYQKERDSLNKNLHTAIAADAEVAQALMQAGGEPRRYVETFTQHEGPAADSLTVPEIAETDMLFLDDPPHKADRLYDALVRHGHKVKRYIVLHDTALYGEMGEGGGAGYLPALRRWMKERPEWGIVYFTMDEYGLCVLSRDARDKKPLPSKITMAANFAKALTKHTFDGGAKVTVAQLEERLSICSMCPNRNGDNCSVCGCPLEKKASWRSEGCPLDFWPELVQLEQAKEEKAA